MKYDHWRQAISIKFDALIHNGTWSFVPPLKDHNIVDYKFLNDSINRYKARLVGKGFT